MLAETYEMFTEYSVPRFDIGVADSMWVKRLIDHRLLLFTVKFVTILKWH
jgi:hypothetical protein